MIRAIALVCAGLLAAAPASESTIVGVERAHTVEPGESWVSIGARMGVTPATLARRNGRSPAEALRQGDTIALDARHIAPADPGVSILVNVPQRLVFLYRAGIPMRHFPAAVGKADWRTPIGGFAVRELEENPTWDVPISIQEEMRREGHRVLTKVPPGPANPLGRHWIGLTIAGVGIHGTNVPTSIYRFTTHGCIRLHPDDIASLFAATHEGDTGRIVYEPVLAAATDDGRVFLEVHPDIYRRVPDLLAHARRELARLGVLDRIDMEAMRRAVQARAGVAIELPPNQGAVGARDALAHHAHRTAMIVRCRSLCSS